MLRCAALRCVALHDITLQLLRAQLSAALRAAVLALIICESNAVSPDPRTRSNFITSLRCVALRNVIFSAVASAALRRVSGGIAFQLQRVRRAPLLFFNASCSKAFLSFLYF